MKSDCMQIAKVYWLVACVMLLGITASQTYACDTYWTHLPSLPTAEISSPSGSRWDHINDKRDFVTLEVSHLVDADTFLGPSPYGGTRTNYIVASSTYWTWNTDRGYCSPSQGTSTKWYATDIGTGAWVKAWLVDQPANLNPCTQQLDSRADDPDTAVTYTNLQGFKVGVRATAPGAWSMGGSTVWEGESQNWSSGASVQHDKAWHNGDSAKIDADLLYAQFEYKTDPPEATPAGDVSATVGFGLGLVWDASVNDNDLWDEGGDSVSVSGGIAYFGGVGMSYSWTLEDAQECIAAGDWAYKTDTGLGINRNPSGTPLWEIQSGDDPDGTAKTYYGNHTLARSTSTTWDKSCPVRGQFDTSFGLNGGPDPSAEGSVHMILHDGWLNVSNVSYSP